MFTRYISPSIFKITGVKTFLNGTRSLLQGPGLNVEEVKQLAMNKPGKSILKKFKDWLLK
jgi:hypothetical protein